MANQLSFGPFEPAAETWDIFIERFECFLQSNECTEMSDLRKKGYFLSLCGREMFKTAKALAAPQMLRDVSWGVILDKLKNHYAPAPSRIARRHAFRRRFQKDGESVSDYVAALRSEASQCDFHDLDDALAEQLVNGVRDLKLQRRLLARKELSLAVAIDEAQVSEMSEKSANELQSFHTPRGTQSGEAAVHQAESDCTGSSDECDSVSRLRTAPKKNRSQAARPFPLRCAGCGGSHDRATCRFKSSNCLRCGKRGHLAKVCRAVLPAADTWTEPARNKKPQRKAFNRTDECYDINHASTTKPSNKIFLTVNLEGAPCKMEVDTGSSKSLISWTTLKRLLPKFSKNHLSQCPVRLRDYQGHPIPILGCNLFNVSHGRFTGRLPLIIVKGSLPSLLGLDWFEAFGLNVLGTHSTSADPFDDVLQEFSDVLMANWARRVPFALRDKVDQEIDRLISQGILEQVDHSPWETPIVVPIKRDGSIRICADYKGTINKALQANPYPVPVVQHLLHSLGQGSIFAKLDLAQAYQQLPVDEATARAQTIVTHRGAFKCKRLQFGVCIAPGLFQSLMERLLHGLEGVVPYFDDILVSATNQIDLCIKLRAILSRIRKAGLKLKRQKCLLGVPKVEFLGFLVDSQGIHPTPSKIEAIRDAPTPANRAELQAFLGLLNFYAIFLPHKASVAEPLHRLLDAKAPWRWDRNAEAAFRAVKSLLTSSAVLVQYDPLQPLSLSCDASPYGIGAVLSHVLPNGSEAPIAYYSRTLSAPERNYSQLDKEALAAVAGIKRFHEYVYGRFFLLVTDHKPLLGLLAGDRQTPPILSPRMSRWTEFLAAYNYRLVYRPGRAIGHADALSRCPLPTAAVDPAPGSTVLLIDEWQGPISASDIARDTSADPILSQVRDWVLRGWPASAVSPEFLPFQRRQHELSALKGCLLWGNRVVAPAALRAPILNSLHNAHPGIVRMKALARSYVWWPKLDSDIELWIGKCQLCQSSRPAPAAAPVREWDTPRSPWSRIHLDFAGPYQGQTFLVLVDAYSRWVELAQMKSTTAEATIRVLERIFATHGLPDIVVSDNGPQFTSASFQSFLARHGIRHAPTAPFHPAANGRAERAVRSAKEALAKLVSGDWRDKIATYLLAQHTTPCPTTNRCPAELLMGRHLRTVLDRLHPEYSPEKPPDSTSGARAFQVGDWVYAQHFGGDPRWLPGQIEEVTGPRSYRVQLEDGRMWRRHVGQLRRHMPPSNVPSNTDLAASNQPPPVQSKESRPENMPNPDSPPTTSPAVDLPQRPHQDQSNEFPSSAAEQAPEVREVPVRVPSTAPDGTGLSVTSPLGDDSSKAGSRGNGIIPGTSGITDLELSAEQASAGDSLQANEEEEEEL
ncbi:uncharacterized protein K02A2.6-like [Ahaetulla prasina]|uniref:uncharacterized protein K02A2.6-like n=1 Tax=Ahaetulla prasina TaxID=499056 RepID=UPI0026484D9D|nr:uncharacterized protein K02A2.6-like [Ahaetulla prasina]